MSKEDSEWIERGKDLERINAIVVAWKAQIPEKCFNILREVLDGYIDRNKSTGATGRKKYRKQGLARKE